MAIRPLIKNNYYLICSYALLLFNPASFANHPMTRVTREGIYCSLTILVISCAIGILLRKNSTFKSNMVWSVILGISLSSLWLTREEGVWIFPLILTLFGYNLILIILFYISISPFK